MSDLHSDDELLVDDGADAALVRLFDDGAHLRAEDVTFVRAVEQRVESGDRLHELNAILLLGETLVDFEEGDDALFLPEVVCGVEVVDLAIHRVLEEDCAEDAALVERGALDDTRTHLMDAREHFLLAAVSTLVDTVRLERLRCGAAALVKRGDKAFVFGHTFELFLIHWTYLLLYENMRGEEPR